MNVKKIREDFPLLLANPDLTYLDSAATSQKPACVLRAEREFYECHNANPLRGLYELSENATKCYEDARKTVQHFIGAARPEEIIFTRNATESLNLVAYSLGSLLLKPGDEVVVSIMEHHSNLLPWQMAAGKTGAVLRFLECAALAACGKTCRSAVKVRGMLQRRQNHAGRRGSCPDGKDENYGNYPDVQRVRLCQRYQRHCRTLSRKGHRTGSGRRAECAAYAG